MAKDSPEDISMTRVRAWVEQHKPTLHELGLRMGFDEGTARQAAYQFLKGKDPRISTLRRFAKAAGLTVEELVGDFGESQRVRND